MMCDPIARTVAADAGQITLELDLPADLPCFQGHFPGFPILAGVVQLDWVMRLSAAYLRCGERSATDYRVKFTRLIVPGSPLTLTLDHDEVRHRLDFVYRTGGLVASRGRVTLAAR
jgi:3-hydroxymyristoyl/3-hydroxydecanoyl-(acyl carrier protein) dehydratase